jgi:hypothetical protein
MIEAYVDNLGKYAEHDHRGEWIKFPASMEDVKALFAKIGVDGVLYEEIIISDYKTDVDGLCKYLDEYESVDELNYLAALLSDMDEWEIEKFAAAIAYGEYTSSAKDLIEVSENRNRYERGENIFFGGVAKRGKKWYTITKKKVRGKKVNAYEKIEKPGEAEFKLITGVTREVYYAMVDVLRAKYEEEHAQGGRPRGWSWHCG